MDPSGRGGPRTTNDPRGAGRYLALGPEDRIRMLDAVGVEHVDELFADIPEPLRVKGSLPLGPSMSEMELLRRLDELAGANASAGGILSFLGAGCMPHYGPSHVDALLQRQEFMTSYTPYQAEVSQGTLQTIFEFQSLICLLTGADVCNASMYDGGSAVAEAVLMASRLRRRGGRVLISEGVHPAHREIAQTYTTHLDIEIGTVEVDGSGRTRFATPEEDVLAVIVQQPNLFGVVEDIAAIAGEVKDSAAKLVVATTEPLALALVKPPGELGADIVVGELQGFGNSINFGGPMVGFMASRKEYVRNLPGRLVGETVDADGRRGYVLTLATREQHIRRAKATSNICTNEALCALATCMYLCSMGRRGLRELAEVNLAKAAYAQATLAEVAGLQPVFDGPHFNELTVKVSGTAAEVVRACVERGVVPGLDLGRLYPDRADELLVCTTEVHSRADIDRLASILAGVCR